MPKGQKASAAKLKELGKTGGRPTGAWSGKPYRDALIRAAKIPDPVSGKRAIQRVADRLFKEAINGDVQAAIEIGNRLDGRVNNNAVENLAISFVVRMPTPQEPALWALDARSTRSAITDVTEAGTAAKEEKAKKEEKANLSVPTAVSDTDATASHYVPQEADASHSQSVISFPDGQPIGGEMGGRDDDP